MQNNNSSNLLALAAATALRLPARWSQKIPEPVAPSSQRKSPPPLSSRRFLGEATKTEPMFWIIINSLNRALSRQGIDMLREMQWCCTPARVKSHRRLHLWLEQIKQRRHVAFSGKQNKDSFFFCTDVAIHPKKKTPHCFKMQFIGRVLRSWKQMMQKGNS